MTGHPGAPPGPGATQGPGATRVDQRPLIERIGLAAIAVVVVALFGAISVAALSRGEIFLGAMAGIGAVMTVWAAAASVRRG